RCGSAKRAPEARSDATPRRGAREHRRSRAPAGTPAAASMPWPRRGQQSQDRCGLWIVRRRFSGSGNLNPAVHTLFAFLHNREVDGFGGIKVARQKALEYELIVPIVR